MTEERALLLWRVMRATGLPARAFGDDVPGNGWTNAKLRQALSHLEDRPPTRKAQEAFLRRYHASISKNYGSGKNHTKIL